MYGPAVRLFVEESLRAQSGSAAYSALRAIPLRFAIEIDPGREKSGSASPLELRYEVPGNGDDNASARRLAQHC
jgi:hypothetical protein